MHLPSRRDLGLVAALVLAGGLEGCGFTPLYATPGVAEGLPSIDVVAPEGRVGFLVREDLEDQIGRDKTHPPAWRLTFTTIQTRDPRGLRVDNVAERYALGLTVKYQLVEIDSGKVAHAGEVTTQISYDAADAPYAGIAARQDTQERAASDVARRIQIELASWLARSRSR